MNNNDKCDEIVINGKIYKLKCEITEVHPMTCFKCGAPLELYFGTGKCSYCNTHYATNFTITEV